MFGFGIVALMFGLWLYKLFNDQGVDGNDDIWCIEFDCRSD